MKRIKREKVQVACDDVGCLTADRQGQELIVLGVAAGGYLHSYIDPLGFPGESCKKVVDILFVDVAAELPAMQHLG